MVYSGLLNILLFAYTPLLRLISCGYLMQEFAAEVGCGNGLGTLGVTDVLLKNNRDDFVALEIEYCF